MTDSGSGCGIAPSLTTPCYLSHLTPALAACSGSICFRAVMAAERSPLSRALNICSTTASSQSFDFIFSGEHIPSNGQGERREAAADDVGSVSEPNGCLAFAPPCGQVWIESSAGHSHRKLQSLCGSISQSADATADGEHADGGDDDDWHRRLHRRHGSVMSARTLQDHPK